MPTLLTVAADSHLSLSRAARELAVTRQRVLSLSAAGVLPTVVMGGRLFFQRAQVEALAERLAAERAVKARRRGRTTGGADASR
jgi:hypothetical protein